MENTTRIYRFHQYGDPEVLRLETVPTQQLGLDEVRVRVQAMSLNRADMLWMANTYVETPELLSRIGYEIAGVVEEVGPGVLEFSVGDRVGIKQVKTNGLLHSTLGQTKTSLRFDTVQVLSTPHIRQKPRAIGSPILKGVKNP